ncbi:hypothetical protein E3N88_38238 [Mikania micrantha]|uniref:Aminotransferase-like plant mobile domain-containing protein n=1 Tax=Mikania micrantha TaxID=192012 RepID=A0A5N6LTE6_9ASTR|nr:hypothetical protein E3N88_38238 [Mikania micrantha]
MHDLTPSMLGFTPSNTDIVLGRIKLLRLLKQLETEFLENPTALQCTQHARVTILYLCGGTLFPDTTWMYECFLILWEVVEPHHSSRVMRQCGLLQHIPNTIPLKMDQHDTIHNLNRGGKLNKDWLRHHQQYLSFWNQHLTNTIDGQHVPTPTVNDDYMRWYRSRTVLYIANPGSEENTFSQVMGLAHEGHRLAVPTHLTAQLVDSLGNENGSQVVRRRGRRRNTRGAGRNNEGCVSPYIHAFDNPNSPTGSYSEFGVTPQHHMDYTVTPNMVPTYQ